MARTQVLLLVVFLLACLLYAPHLTSAAEADPTSPISFNFNFSNVSSYRKEDLRVEGEASLKPNDVFVDLTACSDPSQCKPGRMSYNHSVPLWDNTTNELASFATEFTFNISLPNVKDKEKGDGMAFFLANYPSRLPENSGGYALGLMNGSFPIAYDTDRFIAIEFDTYNNPSDEYSRQKGTHIGIDISSVTYSINKTSFNFSRNGTMKASITFHNITRMLVASLQFLDDSTSAPVQVSAKLPDPRTLLPPDMAVGFSASTGAAYELHRILSWSFSSTLAPPPVHKGMKLPLLHLEYFYSTLIICTSCPYIFCVLRIKTFVYSLNYLNKTFKMTN